MTRRRADCRACGRNSSLNADEHIHPHRAGNARCEGSSRPPAGEPPCDKPFLARHIVSPNTSGGVRRTSDDPGTPLYRLGTIRNGGW